VRVALRTERNGGRGKTPPLVVVAGQKGERSAVVVASGAAEERLAEVLERGPATAGAGTLGHDADVARALERGASNAVAALVFRFQEPSGRASPGTLLLGAKPEGLWADLSGPGALSAFATLPSTR
jgi:hypothetical protein